MIRTTTFTIHTTSRVALFDAEHVSTGSSKRPGLSFSTREKKLCLHNSAWHIWCEQTPPCPRCATSVAQPPSLPPMLQIFVARPVAPCCRVNQSFSPSSIKSFTAEHQSNSSRQQCSGTQHPASSHQLCPLMPPSSHTLTPLHSELSF